jgi:F0F1-type ATP synthase assembly protein I
MKRHLGFDKNFNLHHISEPKKKTIKVNNSLLAKNLNLGYYLVTPIIFGVFFGLFLDNRLKTKKLFFIIFFSLGIIGTFYNLYKIYKDDRESS